MQPTVFSEICMMLPLPATYFPVFVVFFYFWLICLFPCFLNSRCCSRALPQRHLSLLSAESAANSLNTLFLFLAKQQAKTKHYRPPHLDLDFVKIHCCDMKGIERSGKRYYYFFFKVTPVSCL